MADATSVPPSVSPEIAALHRDRSRVRMIKFFGSAILILLLVIVGLLAYAQFGRRSPTFETPYQAVLLAGGQVYYGHLEGFGTPYPVLKDVYYVRVQADPETKQTTNVLIRRGQEWHGPDRMYLNPSHIMLVEPVSPDSQVSKLIAEQQRK